MRPVVPELSDLPADSNIRVQFVANMQIIGTFRQNEESIIDFRLLGDIPEEYTKQFPRQSNDKQGNFACIGNPEVKDPSVRDSARVLVTMVGFTYLSFPSSGCRNLINAYEIKLAQ